MKYFLKKQINSLVNTINSEVLEREDVIKLSILAIFTKESVFLLGPPGVGKSLISRKISTLFEDAKEFSVLMNKFTLTDEIFGPIDINRLKEGHFTRKVTNYLPDANIAFLDEIWKASSSIQNTLLTILNEKIFVNDGKSERVNLYFVIAASNELPERNQSLEALWDRFLIKFDVLPIQNNEDFLKMITNQVNVLQTNRITKEQQLNFQIVDNVNAEFKDILVPQKILDFISKIKAEIEAKNKTILQQNPFADGFDQYYVSDRKWKKIIGALQASAYLNERTEVDVSDINMISYMLWNNIEQFEYYKKLINRHIFECKYNELYLKKEQELEKLRNKLIHFTTVRFEKEEVLIETVTNPKGVEYYCFVDKNKQIYYFLKSEINAIPTKARFSIDWLISYVDEDKFNEGLEPIAKLLVKYEDHKFFIYENNDETQPAIEIFTNFKKDMQTKYELIKISAHDADDWSNLCLHFVADLTNEMNKIDYNIAKSANDPNIFWTNDAIKEDAISANVAKDKLENLVKILHDLDAQKDQVKVGFSLTNLDSLYPLNFDKK